MINLPVNDNKKLRKVLSRANKDSELSALFDACNVMLVDRMGYTDHGKVHVAIVSNIAIKLLRMLIEHGITPGIVKEHKLDTSDAEVVVFLGAILHDIGNSVHRVDHASNSLILARPILERLLKDYETRKRSIITSEVLHCIVCHEKGFPVHTLEAGIVRVADALDMKEGRARIPFNAGSIDIHSVSAMSIKEIKILKGPKKPILIDITLSNSAGIFQIDSLFKEKLAGSLLEEYIAIHAKVEHDVEKSIIKDYTLG